MKVYNPVFRTSSYSKTITEVVKKMLRSIKKVIKNTVKWQRRQGRSSLQMLLHFLSRWKKTSLNSARCILLRCEPVSHCWVCHDNVCKWILPLYFRECMFILLPLFVFPSVCFRFHLAAIFDWPATVDKPREVLTEPDSQGDWTPHPPPWRRWYY